MKYNMNNNNDMMQAMQEMMQAMFLQGMAQGAQAMQAQAMGAGDAGKPLPVSLPQGAGQAQGKRKGAGRRQAQGMAQAQAQGAGQSIQWQAIQRQNERQTVYDVRQAMVNGQDFSGLVKAWLVLNEGKVPADDRVLKVCHDMECACLQGKGMKVKGASNAHFEVASMVTVKRAFYCAMRGMPIIETRQDVRPETRGKRK